MRVFKYWLASILPSLVFVTLAFNSSLRHIGFCSQNPLTQGVVMMTREMDRKIASYNNCQNFKFIIIFLITSIVVTVISIKLQQRKILVILNVVALILALSGILFIVSMARIL